MTVTLLLDLDNTLLTNEIDPFIREYFQKFADYLADQFLPDQLINSLLAGTRHMINNNNPDCTLEEIFDSIFYPRLGVAKQDLEEKLEIFYADVFPELRVLVHPRPQAMELVENALNRGYTLCIATNPLFPREAVIQRIRWAGLNPDSFQLITSFEDFHFAKPNPAYYTEILSRLVWPDGPIIMVGDHPVNDIQGAQKADLATFWITGEKQDLANPKAGAGKLEDLLPWIDRFTSDQLSPVYYSASACSAGLLATPAVLDSWLENLPLAAWTYKPELEEWALNEIVCHFRDVDREVNLPRLEIILREKNPFITGVDTDPWAQSRNYLKQDGLVALHQFFRHRSDILELISGLQAEEWNRPARHSIFGPTDLLEVAWLTARHDRMHISQIFETLSNIPPNIYQSY